MDDFRFQDLLAEALAIGRVPDDASDDERTRLAELLETASTLRAAATTVRAEATAALPHARARFQRHVVASRQASFARPAAVLKPARRAWWSVFVAHRGLALGGAAVALALLAVVATFALQSAGGNVETAQALNPGDYVQFEGVVETTGTAAGGRSLQLQTADLGAVTVDLAADTPVVAGEAQIDSSALAPGKAVVVAGVVGQNRRVAASALTVSAQTPVALPRKVPFKKLERLLPGLEGRIVTFAVASGTRASVILEAADGNRYLLAVDEQSAQRLLALVTVLGARVAVSRDAASPAGTFSLAVTEEPDAATGGRLSLSGVEGVVTARNGTTFTVLTRGRGPVEVVIRPATRILVTRNAVDQARFVSGKDPGVGHVVVVSGVLDSASGRLTAGLVIVGARLARVTP
ncbi:MAG: hypothetical protein IT304_10125 [Dehalococcoidia bacterium]|nr:hypothetical protein [Dehalococcoidia bacterium]